MKWLGDEISATDRKAMDFLIMIEMTRNKNDRYITRRRVVLESTAHCIAINAWHHNVEKDHIRPRRCTDQ